MSLPTEQAVGFRSLGLEVALDGVPDAVEHSLRQRWATAAAIPVTARLDLRFAALPVPSGKAALAQLAGQSYPVQVQDNEVWLDTQLHLRLGPESSVITAQRPDVPEALWMLAFAEVQRAAGWLPLHAATVAATGPDGQRRALSVSGPSGAGKSTLALRLLQVGLEVLAEDQTWVHPASRQITGLDRCLRAYPDSLSRFAPQLDWAALPQDIHGKRMVPLPPVDRPAWLEGLLVFGLPEPCSRAQIVQTLWDMSGLPLSPLARQRSALGVAELARDLPVQATARDRVLSQVTERLGLSSA